MPGKKLKTIYPGVRYREHTTRKHGTQKDKYYFIRYQLDGKRKEEGLGWASKDWTPKKANEELARLQRAQRTGEGPVTLEEKRKLENEERKAREEKEKQDAILKITFGEYFKNEYYPVAKTSKKHTSYEKEMTLYKHWIESVIGKKPFNQIAPTDIERIKRKLLAKKRAPKTIEYVFATIRQVWNMARRDGLISGESPTKAVRKPKKDNRRDRFLTHDEANTLLNYLKEKSDQLHNMALLSLHTGMRAGEIFSLVWGDADIERGIIMIRDPKASKNRAAYMTREVKKMFKGLKRKDISDLVFTDKRHGGKIKEISHAFRVAVNDLKMNEGITDPRQKVVFHTLRHTFASWLVENGTDLYTVKDLMGHSTLAMTERYAHLGENTRQEAVKKLDRMMNKRKKKGSEKASKKSGGKKVISIHDD